MGFYCTSSIEALMCDDRVHVTYYVEHHDHDLDFRSLVHMKLPRNEKDKIAGMLIINIFLPKTLPCGNAALTVRPYSYHICLGCLVIQSEGQRVNLPYLL